MRISKKGFSLSIAIFIMTALSVVAGGIYYFVEVVTKEETNDFQIEAVVGEDSNLVKEQILERIAVYGNSLSEINNDRVVIIDDGITRIERTGYKIDFERNASDEVSCFFVGARYVVNGQNELVFRTQEVLNPQECVIDGCIVDDDMSLIDFCTLYP